MSEVLDRNGIKIEIGQRIRFFYPDNNVWDADVTFEDGMLTINPFNNIVQVRNPDGWDRPHNWIDSRWWGCSVGYPEFGTWNCTREPIVKIAKMWKTYEEVKPLHEKFGFEHRIINAEILSLEETQQNGERL